MKYFSKLLVFSWLLFSVVSQAQEILWEKSYGGKHAEYLFDAIPTPDYGFILAGSSISGKSGNKESKSNGDFDYWLWKMNESGDLDWQKSFGGDGTDLLQSIAITKDGGFILAGTSTSGISEYKKQACKGNEDNWIIKLDAKGNEMWQTTIGGFGQEKVSKVLVLKDGSYLIAGSSSSYKDESLSAEDQLTAKSENAFGNLDYWLVKLNKEGKIVWQKTFGGTYRDELQSVIQTNDGTLLAGGYSNSPISGNKTAEAFGLGDFWVIALDADGNQKWQTSFGGTQDDQLSCMLNTQNNGYLIAGSSDSAASSSKQKGSEKGSDFWILNFNENHEHLWQQTFNYGSNDVLTSIIENDDQTFLIAGYAQSEKNGKKDQDGINDYIALKIKDNGEEIWTKTVGSNGDEVMKKAVETRDGGYLLVGTSNSNTSLFPSAGGVPTGRGGNSKDRNTNKGGNDFWVVKLKDPTKPDVEKLPIEALPNPAETFTNIVLGYNYTAGDGYIYDLAGRQLQQFKLNGNRTVPVDMSTLPMGIYIIEVITNKEKHGIKIIKK
jgi:hypothetical protein